MTTLGVGGPARYFCEGHSERDVREAVVFARERDLPVFIMGGGSNLVVSDAGFAGLVLKVALLGITERSLSGRSSAVRRCRGRRLGRLCRLHRAIAVRGVGVP